jgi:hypothetical protein
VSTRNTKPFYQKTDGKLAPEEGPNVQDVTGEDNLRIVSKM